MTPQDHENEKQFLELCFIGLGILALFLFAFMPAWRIYHPS